MKPSVTVTKTIGKDYVSHVQYEHVMKAFRQIPEFNLNKNIEKRIYSSHQVIPLKKHFTKVFSLEATINGKRVRLLVDTGAQISALFDGVNIDLKEEKEHLIVGSISGQTQNQKLYRAKQVQFGGVELFNVGFTKLNPENFKILGIKVLRIDGILGWDVLSQFDFSLSEKALTIYTNIETSKQTNMIQTTFPTLLANDPSGHLVVLGFDSGAHNSWIAESEIQRMILPLKEQGNALTMGVHGLEKINVKVVEQVKYFLANHSILLKDIHTGYTQIFPNFKYNGILGNELLHGYTIYFINSKSVMLLEENKT